MTSIKASGKITAVRVFRQTRLQRMMNKFLPEGLRAIGECVYERIQDEHNLILNGGLTTSNGILFDNTPGNATTFTSTALNYEDMGGTWTQSDGGGAAPGNIVTRVTTGIAPNTFPSSPTQVGNELQFQDGERSLVVSRTSDTQVTVSGPPRLLVGKTIRRWFTNLASSAGSVQTKATVLDSTSYNFSAGTKQMNFSVLFDPAGSGYTVGSIMFGLAARVVLSSPVPLLAGDQLQLQYSTLQTVSGRATRTIPLSSVIPGYPFEFAIATMSGDGTTVTVTTSVPHNFVTNDLVTVKNAVPLRKAITSVASDGTTWTITSTGHGRSVSDNIVHEGISNAAYNGSYTVASVPDADTYTITNAANPGAATGGTNRLATPGTYFDGDYTVATAPDSTTLTFTSDKSGPAIDTAARVHGRDEIDITIAGGRTDGQWLGELYNSSSTNRLTACAYNEANKKPTPSITDTSLPNTTPSFGNEAFLNANQASSSPSVANDMIAQITTSAIGDWGPGTSENRVAQIIMGANKAIRNADTTGGWIFVMTFRTPQPKGTSYRLNFPTLYMKCTRDLVG